jgi:hypothetical protein
LFVETLDVDRVFVVEIGLDVLDYFEDNVSVEDEFFITFFADLFMYLFEDE